MKLTQDQKARFIGTTIKTCAVVGFVSVIGLLLYNVATAEKIGR